MACADTVEVTRPAARGCLTIQRIRLYGVDAPERRQTHGDVATRFTAAYLFNHQVNVKVVSKDRYGRRVADLCRGKSVYRCISYQLVRNGHGWWYQTYAPDDARLKRAEAYARKKERGLWREKNPIPPWDWRRQSRRRR